jgi:SAM-dependent methyltransferase
MHKSAYNLGLLFFQNYWKSGFESILDVGSLNINGSLREVAPVGAKYIGIDLEKGAGVDRVLEDAYCYPFDDETFDMVVSTSCFEHDPMFWLTFLEACRVLRTGGIFYINAPSNGWYHTHPWDNWRFYPDASLALEMWAMRSGQDIRAVESFTSERCEPWNDYVMIFAKGDFQPDEAQFLSGQVNGAMNIRRITQPGIVLNHRKNNTDTPTSAHLHGLMHDVQKEIEKLKA